MSLNAALHTAGRSLDLFSTGVQIAGQNISNANTPGYVRESLILQSGDSYNQNGLLRETGAQALGVQQQLDFFLETRIHSANSDVWASSGRVDAYNQLQTILGELSTNDLSSGLNEFAAALQNLVNEPESITLQQNVISQGEQLATQIQTLRSDLDRARGSTTERVGALVEEANGLIDQIAGFNKQIVSLEAGGLLHSDAGAIRTQRLNAVNRLSEILPIKAVERENGTLDIVTGSDYLVLNANTQHLESIESEDDGVLVNRVQIRENKYQFLPASGEIRGVIEGRDEIIGGFTKQLDSLTKGLIQTVNVLHSRGEGVSGFESVTGSYQVDDSAATLNQAGLDFTVQHGQFEIKIINTQTGTEETSVINIDLDGLGSNDTTLANLQSTLDGLSNLTASITTDGRLRITAASGYEFKVGKDNSGVLAALGINTFFTGNGSSTIAVNTVLRDDPGLLATGQGGGPGDNTNLVTLAEFLHLSSDQLGGANLDDYYNSLVGQLATSASSENAVLSGFEGFRDSLNTQRLQTSGVSLDEETINILQYQQSYQAAARIISTVNELFQVLLNI